MESSESMKITMNLKSLFKTDIQDFSLLHDNRILIRIVKNAIVLITTYLFHAQKFRFITATALETKEGIEIFYHFNHDETGIIININVVLPFIKPEIESITNTILAANWIEREMHELYGITFLNHPDPVAFISSENWVNDEFPNIKKRTSIKE